MDVTSRFKAEPVDGKRHFQRLRGCICSVSGCGFGGGIVVHHERRGTGGGTGLKPRPEHCLPLCGWHHTLGHQIGWDTFEQRYHVDLKMVAQGQAIVSRAMGLLSKEPTE
jgi:hypothetical protein